MSTNNPSDKTPMSRRGLLTSALAAGAAGALGVGTAGTAAAAEVPPREPDSPWVKGSGLRFADEWVPLPADYPWRPGRIIYYTVMTDNTGGNARRVWAVVLPDGSQWTFPEEAFIAQLRMAFAERGWQWVSTSHPAASHVVIHLDVQDFVAAGLPNAPTIS